MFQSQKESIYCLVLLLLSVFIYSRGLSVHGIEYRDDEIFYYKSTQEMISTGNYFSPKYFGEDRFQKPILYYWLIVVSYMLFGVNWFAARFVAVVFAGLSVCLTWLLCKRLFNRRVADLSVVVLMTIPLFFRHAKNAVPDMVLNFFIVLAVYYGVRVIQATAEGFSQQPEATASSKDSLLYFVACAIGFMIKGFAALLIPLLTIILYSLTTRNIKILYRLRLVRGLLIMCAIIGPWFLYMLKIHGQEYLSYMLVDETKNRLMTDSSGNVLLKVAANFFDHIIFYLGIIGSYFAPWYVFLIGGIPLAFKNIRSDHRTREGLRLMLIWFFVVLMLFSMMYFSINHYMLVLSTPFAVLVSYFLLENFDQKFFLGRALRFLRKYISIFIFTIGVIAFGFLFVFMAGAGKGWLAILLLAYFVFLQKMLLSEKPVTAPSILGIFLLFVFAQSTLLDKAGITTHAALQKFARTIHREIQAGMVKNPVIGVGSHDIHEKEFQVYFDQRVEKAADSVVDETRTKLSRLFSTEKELYCLITEKDFHQFLEGSFSGTIEIIQEDYIVRKRFHIDSGFFLALFKLDQKTVQDYMMEKLVLVRKKSNV
jgi:4-amino-4-deoxy-L-arabinose transferase-like glycosyltransferase